MLHLVVKFDELQEFFLRRKEKKKNRLKLVAVIVDWGCNVTIGRENN